jgi:PTS system nitrogen regulatory IIA component
MRDEKECVFLIHPSSFIPHPSKRGDTAMGSDMMDMEQLASYLRRDVREVGKLVSRGHLPGHKVGGQWRFARAEINQWIETQLPAYTEKQLADLESSGRGGAEEPLIAGLLSEASVAVPLVASTKASVLRELVALAEQSWQVYDPTAILDAIKQREEMGSTALPNGVAIPHPRRPLPNALGESVLAYARTTSGIPFGAPRGELTDIFFLVCCRDDQTHLRVLARLTRLLMQPGFLDELRETETAAESWEKLAAAEQVLLGS